MVLILLIKVLQMFALRAPHFGVKQVKGCSYSVVYFGEFGVLFGV